MITFFSAMIEKTSVLCGCKGDPEDDSCDHSDNDDTQDEEEFSNPEVYTEEEMEACLLYTSRCV